MTGSHIASESSSNSIKPRPLKRSEEEQVAAWRRDTPGLSRVNHLNSAGASLMPRSVVEAMASQLELESQVGGYEAEALRQAAIQDTYEAIGSLLNARSNNIGIACSATQAFLQALSTVDWKSGDVLVTSTLDYTSQQIVYLSLAERLGVRVVRAPDLPEGGVDPEGTEKLLATLKPRMVAMSWVPTHSGVVQDLPSVGRLCNRYEIPFIVDACQVVGQMPIDVASLGCDYLSATGRKFLRGPRGIGFLYASDRALGRGDHPLNIDMRGAKWVELERYEVESGARRFEEWEHSYINVLGLGEAVRYALEVGLDRSQRRAWALADRLRGWAEGTSRVRPLEEGRSRSAIVTLGFDPTVDISSLVERLRKRKINTSATLQWYGLADLGPRNIDAALRVSPHYFNTEDDLSLLEEALNELVLGRA